MFKLFYITLYFYYVWFKVSFQIFSNKAIPNQNHEIKNIDP